MKKVVRFFALAALAFSTAAFVACGDDDDNNGGAGNTENLPTTLEESFGNGVPSNWTNIDADGDGYSWQDWIYDQNGGVLSTEGMIVSASFLNGVGALTPDNYLVSPKLYIEKGTTLSYEVGAVDADYYQDHYAVLLGTVENGVFNAEATIVEENVPNPNAATTRTFDLSDYAGKSYCIAFRHFNCTDMYIMTLDNVVVSQGAKKAAAAEKHNFENVQKVK